MIARCATAAAVVVLSLAATATASTINFVSGTGLNQLGSFVGTIEYAYSSGKNGTLTLSITNTSPAANGGFITGLAFNAPRGVKLEPASGFGSFGLLGQPSAQTVSANPWGNYSWAIVLGDSWIGGGRPVGGIPVGQTRTFVLSVVSPSAAVASALTSASFFTRNSPSDPAMAVRLRGFVDGGSDRAPAEEWNPASSQPNSGPVTTPLPGAALAGSVGLLGLISRRR